MHAVRFPPIEWHHAIVCPALGKRGPFTAACLQTLEVKIALHLACCKICSILSRHGFLIIIPRELGLVRLYVQFPEDWEDSGKSSTKDDPSVCQDILKAAQKIFEPYTMDYKYCDWWTVYRIGQRVANHASYLDRVFLADRKSVV